ncbi:MAG: hypothetical protein RQ894_01095 [Candidatus Pacebacteria bacterium]|jgi:hypothetical protein|nr:hypothetical protein [Candidatus Paceibacterota bacterium]
MSLLDSLFRRKKQQPKQTPEPQTEQNQAEQVQLAESEIKEAIRGLRIFLDNNLYAIQSGTLDVLGNTQFRWFEIIKELPLWSRLPEGDRIIIETYINQSKMVRDIRGSREVRGYQLNVQELAEALENLLNLLREEEKKYRSEHR